VTQEAAGAATPSPSPSATPNDCISTSPAEKSKCDLHTTIAEIVAPDAPAFTILGINPTNVSKPSSPAELAASVINAFDDNGHFQSGAALDVVPFLALAGRSFSLGEYVKPSGSPTRQKVRAYETRLLSRTSVSFATIRGTSTPDTSVRMATGFRTVLIDRNDPRAAFQVCVGKVDIPLDPNNPDDPERAKKIQTAIAQCRDEAKKRVWNATSLTIAGAPSWISTDGSASSLKTNGGGYWVSLAMGHGRWGQTIVNARRETGQLVVPASGSAAASANGNFVVQDTTVAGGAFRVGRADFNAIIEGLYIGKRTAGVPDSYPEFGFGVEKKLAERIYLELNYRYDATSSGTSGLLTNLKWSFSQEPKLATK
jgi:hypothetical protein